MKTSPAILFGAVVFASVLLAGPAHAVDADDAARLALAVKHAGEPVDHVTFFPAKRSRSGWVNSWEVLGERQLLVWHGKQKAWLVDLRKGAACRSLDKQFQIRVSGGFDALNVRNGYIHSPNGICRIEQIRPLNVEAMRAEESAETALAKN